MFLERGIEKKMERIMLTNRERELMHVLFGGELTKDIMHTLTEDFDIDTANQNYILMLSCMGYMKNWEFFPPEIVPRLKGVHRYYQVRNSMGIPWLLQQLRILTDAGIPVMLIKGIAMRAYYALGTPRLMWDYDIAVPEARYEETIHLLCKSGNVLTGEWGHSSSIAYGTEELDVHRWIFKTNEEKGSDLWERAVHFSFYNIEVCVPSPEDMFIHQLDTQSRNFFRNEAMERRMKWLYDCRRILETADKFDVARIAARARELNVTNQVHFMMKQFCCCFPDLIQKKQLEAAFPSNHEYYKWLKNEMDYKTAQGKKWEKYKSEWEKYKKIYPDYTTGGELTPMRALRIAKLEFAEYQYRKPEMRRTDPDLNLWRYFKKTRHLNSFSEVPGFLINYMMRLFSSKSESEGDA